MKLILQLGIFCTALLFTQTLLVRPAQAGALGLNDSYQAVVQIKTYGEDNYHNLIYYGQGSGVIINSQGDILTNYHVVHLEDRFRDPILTGYIICLTTSLSIEPECKYSAKVVDKNKELDLALLRITNIESLSSTASFPYLDRADYSTVKTGNEVFALGYPSIGGKTITVTTDTVAGSLVQYQKQWIKTGAVTSFGSSGGALLNDQGKLIGITSEAHSDYVGSLGYAISTTTIEPWLTQASVKTGTSSVLQNRMDVFIRNQQSLRHSMSFIYPIPQISLVRSSDWKFYYDNENKIEVGTEDPDGGYFLVTWYPTELLITQTNLDVTAKILQETTSLIPQGNMTVGGKTGKKFAQQVTGGGDAYTVILPYKHYVVSVVWYEGKDKKDKTKIDNLFQSLSIREESITFTEQRRYEHAKPSFTLSVSRPWVMMALDNPGYPVKGQNQSVSEVSYGVYIIEQSSGTQGATNEQYLDSIKDVIAKDFIGSTRFTPKRYQSSSNYRISNGVAQSIHYRYRFENEESGNKAEWFGAGYRIRTGDRVIAIILDYYGNDQKKFDAIVKQFEKEALSGFSLTKGASNSSADVQSTTQKKFGKKGNSFIGKILIRFEKGNEVWYVGLKDNIAYLLNSAQDAYPVLQQQGIGIKNEDLAKIPIGLSVMNGDDSDSDGLTDAFENAIGSDSSSLDSDHDGLGDKKEIEKGTFVSVLGSKRIQPNKTFANKHKGKLFVQIEGKGELWYINPRDGKRYFLGGANEAFQVLKMLGVKISEKDFKNL